MIRIATGLLLLVLLIGLGAPYAIGALTEQAIRKEAGAAAEWNLDLTVQRYDRGWLRSDATVELGLEDFLAIALAQAGRSPDMSLEDAAALLAGLPRALAFHVEIRHGPFTSATELTPVLSRSIVRLDRSTRGLPELLEALGTEDLLELRLTNHLDGSSSFRWTLLPWRWTDEPSNFVVAFSGAESTGIARFADRTFEAEGSSEQLMFRGDDASFSIDGIRTAARGQLRSPNVFVGSSAGSIDRVALQIGDTDIAIDSAAFRSEIAADDTLETLDLDHHYTITEIAGIPEISIRDASLVMRLERLDVELVREWTEFARELRTRSDAPLETEAFRRLEPAIMRALSRSPVLTWGPAQLDWNGETLAARISIRIAADSIPADIDFAEPMRLLPALRVEGHIILPSGIAKAIARQQASRQVQPLVEQGLVSEAAAEGLIEQQATLILDQLVLQRVIEISATGYRTQISFDGSRLDVNGVPIPLGAFLP